jgi:hypothetical protein
MTATSFAFGDPRAQSVWSPQVYAYALQNIFFTKMMGNDGNAAVFVNTDLTVKKGGTVVVEEDDPLTNNGVGDDGNTTTTGEGQLTVRNMSVTVHERANAVVSNGKLSEQLTATNIREKARKQLGLWLGEVLEKDILTAAYGGYNENSGGSTIDTVNDAAPAGYPSTNRIFYGGQNAAGTIGNSGASYGTDALLTAGGVTTANVLCGTLMLEAIKRRCMAATPRFRPVTVYNLNGINDDDVRSGKNLGEAIAKVLIVLLHPLQIKAIKAETGATGWAAMTAAAQVRGNQNPIFQGASFYWDGMLCFEYDRVPTRTGAGATAITEGFHLNTATPKICDDVCANGKTVARAMFLGGQALSFCWAQKPEWSEDMVDNNKPKVKCDMLYGVKRTIFNAHGGTTPDETEAIYCLDTQVVVDA